MVYWLAKIVLTPVFRVLFRVRVEGLEHVPKRGPVILASNHVAFCDSQFLIFVLRRRVTFVAKAEYFEHWKTRWFFQAMGMIPIKRGAVSAWRGALDAAEEVLGAGRLFGIYPEGTRSKDGRLQRGHTGIARVALRTGAPVIPVGIAGTREAQPIGKLVPKPFSRVAVRFGPPLDFSEFAGRERERVVLRQLTDTVMGEIQRLSGQDLADNFHPPRRSAESA